MKLLFDQNLSHRLLSLLADLFPDSRHVREVGLSDADDLTIWKYAQANRLVIVTQDSDYADWNKLRGAPPKIVWVRSGNTSVDQMYIKIRNAFDRIQELEKDPNVEVVEIW
jgi:predicted nuclease of predicted toxin-antitoxin system